MYHSLCNHFLGLIWLNVLCWSVWLLHEVEWVGYVESQGETCDTECFVVNAYVEQL